MDYTTYRVIVTPLKGDKYEIRVEVPHEFDGDPDEFIAPHVLGWHQWSACGDHSDSSLLWLDQRPRYMPSEVG